MDDLISSAANAELKRMFPRFSWSAYTAKEKKLSVSATTPSQKVVSSRGITGRNRQNEMFQV